MIAKKTFQALLLLSSGLAVTTAANAQSNKTFTGGNGATMHIVKSVPGNATFLLGESASYDLLLKGVSYPAINLILDRGYSLNGATGKKLYPKKMVTTPTNELIVAGYIWDPGSNVVNPFAARFSSTGTPLWLYEYNSNPPAPGSSGALTQNDVNICRVEDAPSESYIIVCSGADNARSTGSGLESFVNAIRITGTGVAVWNNKYVPTTVAPGAPPLSSNLNDLRDRPSSLAFINGPGGTAAGRYFIGGEAAKYYPGMWSDAGFMMSIDNAGNIVDPYQTISTSLHWQQNAIYDNSTQEVLLSYTTGNVGTGISTSASAVAVTHIDASGPLTPLRHGFYTIDSAVENYGGGITTNVANDAYYISFNTYNPLRTAPFNTWHTAMMKVDKTTDIPQFIMSYNREREAFNTGGIVNISAGPENFPIGNTIYDITAGTKIPNMRQVSPDVTGNACGFMPEMINYTLQTNGHMGAISTYATKPEAGQFSYSLSSTNLSGVTDCWPSPNHLQYKISQPEATVSIYPTLLRGESFLNLDINLPEADLVTATLYTVDGKIIRSYTLELSKGNTSKRLDVSGLQAGNFLLRVAGANGTIGKTLYLSQL